MGIKCIKIIYDRCEICRNKLVNKSYNLSIKCLECSNLLTKKDLMKKTLKEMDIENEIRIRNDLYQEYFIFFN